MVSEITPAGILNAAAVSRVKKTKRAERKGFGDDVEAEPTDESKTQTAQAPLGTSSIGALFNTLNSQQQVDQKSLDRGNAMLDKLEQLKLEIVSGAVSKSVLLDLQDMLSQAKNEARDPKLKQILLDIEARAAVELAKLKSAIHKK